MVITKFSLFNILSDRLYSSFVENSILALVILGISTTMLYVPSVSPSNGISCQGEMFFPASPNFNRNSSVDASPSAYESNFPATADLLKNAGLAPANVGANACEEPERAMTDKTAVWNFILVLLLLLLVIDEKGNNGILL